MHKVVLENGKEYQFNFPSIGVVKKLSATLGTDLFTNGLKDIVIPDLLKDEKKSQDVLGICLKDCSENILDEITPGDFDLILTSFFFLAKIGSVTLPKGLNDLKTLINPVELYNLQQATESILPFIPRVTEDPKA